MSDLVWLVRRLKAMSIPEIMWRISQKKIQRTEARRFRTQQKTVTDSLFYKELSNLKARPKRLRLNLQNTSFSLHTKIPLPGGYSYDKYRSEWNAGFQTKNVWPKDFSYSLEYKQRDDIGDARTNWELNRHFQFALLAKNYRATGEQKYLKEFQELFVDWNKKNPFLWGISWTSVMEVAIRCSNWCYAYCFLITSEKVPEYLLNELHTGILNMTEYVSRHYSRFSSANNHLIVEAYAIGQSGILFENTRWTNLALSILTRELPLQNYSDGINKELSLHYQSFYMEAMGLMMRLLKKNDIKVPEDWPKWLDKMCCYLADCQGDYGEVIEFGDNDEGKILDLSGGLNHYKYVLEMFSLLLDKQYCNMSTGICENIKWLFTAQEIEAAKAKTRYTPLEAVCYRVGGNSIFRSTDRKILIGIDHAALGFGSIAAHGHADALSFQMYVKGNPVFVDPGTYIYHCDLQSRNAYRKTENHNTICIERKNQSEMLGAFLWGRRAESKLLKYEDKAEGIEIQAQQDGYFPIIHKRTYKFDKNKKILILDELSESKRFQANFMFAPGIEPEIKENLVYLRYNNFTVRLLFQSEDSITVVPGDKMYSSQYGVQALAKSICVTAVAGRLSTDILISYEEICNEKE